MPDHPSHTVTAALLALAVTAGAAHASGQLAIERHRPPGSAALTVTSTAIGADGRIAARYSAYGANRSPAVRWTPVARARSYALVLEDPDAPSPQPFTHWLVWNLDAPQIAEGALPAGAVQGRNGAGATGYHGPHPPSGAHHYHFEIFALDARLGLPAGADREALLRAMAGHVVAAGETVGLFSPPAH